MAIEPRRRCGYRKVGGLYLVADGLAETCHRLPFELSVCPTCHAGIKPARGWSWLAARALFTPGCIPPGVAPADVLYRAPCAAEHCPRCVVCSPELFPEGSHGAGLLWIGQQFYPTPHDFTGEASMLGVSRRIARIPRGFKVGETWVLLAHQLGVPVVGELSLSYRPGIFRAFRPQRVEKIVRHSDVTPELREQAEHDGITLVEVPDQDRDHQGSVYDRTTEPAAPVEDEPEEPPTPRGPPYTDAVDDEDGLSELRRDAMEPREREP